MIRNDPYIFEKYQSKIEYWLTRAVEKHGKEVYEYGMEIDIEREDERLLQVGPGNYTFQIKDYVYWKDVKDTKLYKVLG